MSHTHASVLVQCVFSTKGRLPLNKEPEALGRYLALLAQDRKIQLFAASGTANHVHLLISVPPALCLATALRELKAHSSRWIREHGCRFAWQEGYGAFSVSQAQRQAVIDYIGARKNIIESRRLSRSFSRCSRRQGWNMTRGLYSDRAARAPAGARSISPRYPALRLRLSAGRH